MTFVSKIHASHPPIRSLPLPVPVASTSLTSITSISSPLMLYQLSIENSTPFWVHVQVIWKSWNGKKWSQRNVLSENQIWKVGRQNQQSYATLFADTIEDVVIHAVGSTTFVDQKTYIHRLRPFLRWKVESLQKKKNLLFPNDSIQLTIRGDSSIEKISLDLSTVDSHKKVK